MSEYWDACDAQGQPTGQLLRREEPIPPELYHLVAEVLVRHRDGSWLLMHRDPGKDRFPGLWEATAGGSVLAGESVAQAARRELWEETGLQLQALHGPHRVVGNGWILDYFLAEVDGPKAVRLQPGETVGHCWVNTPTLGAMIAARQLMHTRWLAELLDRLGSE